LQHWDLPDEFAHLRRLMEARMGRKGKREYIQVLPLMELFAQPIVAAAIGDAIKLGAIGFDAVRARTQRTAGSAVYAGPRRRVGQSVRAAARVRPMISPPGEASSARRATTISA
jgi:hypothetical protein